MGEILKEKEIWFLSAAAFLAMAFTVPFSKMELPLAAGSFLQYCKAALASKGMLFLIPVLAVPAAGASYVREAWNGYLKLYAVRISRMDYIRRKICLVYAGGFLPFFAAGILFLLFGYLFVYPLELKGAVEIKQICEVLCMLLRICFTGGIMAEISGIFAAVFCNYYMAYGLPFVSYSFLVILKERYLPELYALYPAEWIVPKQSWGAGGMGIWIFFLVFTAGVCLLHGLVLYYRLREI